MKELEVKIADCSSDILVKTAIKCGFTVKQGKHYKIETTDGRFVTTIPRHKRLKRELVKGVVESFNLFGAQKVLAK